MKKIIYIVLLTLVACQFSEKEFYPTGELKQEYYLNEDGLKDGKSLEYYQDGTIKSEFYFVNGKAEGIGKSYFPSGNIEAIASFKGNLMNGVCTHYTKNGNVISIVEYYMDLKNGEAIFYYDNGSLKMKATSRNDTTVYYKSYSKDSVLIDFYRKVNFKPEKDTVIQGEEFRVEFEVLGNLDDIEKVGFLNNGWFTLDDSTFDVVTEVKRKYYKTFYAKDTGAYLLNFRIWEKDTAYTELYRELYANPKTVK
jgi:hypothetical protein